MADPTSDRDDLFAQWRKQVEAGTDAWIKTVREMAGQGHAPPPPDPMQFWRQFSGAGPMGAPPFPGMGPVDPAVLAQWKRFLDDWIAAWSRALEQAMGTEAFAEALGKTLDQFLTVQGKARQAAERSAKAAVDAVGLPSREQVVGLSRQLMDLEDRIEALEDKIEDIRNEPPSMDLGDRLEALADKLEALTNSAPNAPATSGPQEPRRPGRPKAGGARTDGPKAGDGAAKTRRAAAKTGGGAAKTAGSPKAGDSAARTRRAGQTGGGTAKTGGDTARAASSTAKPRGRAKTPKRRT